MEMKTITKIIIFAIALVAADRAVSADDADNSKRNTADRDVINLEESESVRSRVTLHQGDVRDFDLGQTFALAIMPFRVLQHLIAGDDQLRCLETVARHLAPDGQLIFDVYNPHFAQIGR